MAPYEACQEYLSLQQWTKKLAMKHVELRRRQQMGHQQTQIWSVVRSELKLLKLALVSMEAPVEVSVCWALDVQGAAADVVDSLIVQHDSDISMLKQRVCGQHAVVGLHDSCGDLHNLIWSASFVRSTSSLFSGPSPSINLLHFAANIIFD